MPSDELRRKLRGDVNDFFIVRIEDMYKHVTRAVPASRATSHSCMLITEGSASMMIGASKYTAVKNEMLFVPAGQIFSFQPGETNKGIICSFNDDFVTRGFIKKEALRSFTFLKPWGQPKVSPSPEQAGFIEHCLLRMLATFTETGTQPTTLLQSYLLAMLNEVQYSYEVSSPQKNDAATMLTTRFKELLFTNVCTINRVADYAAMLNVTPNHLNKTVKQVTCQSPTRLIDEALVVEAKILLIQTPQTIGEIASTIGINDASYLARLFKKYTGITPTAFRTNND